MVETLKMEDRRGKAKRLAEQTAEPSPRGDRKARERRARDAKEEAYAGGEEGEEEEDIRGPSDVPGKRDRFGDGVETSRSSGSGGSGNSEPDDLPNNLEEVRVSETKTSLLGGLQPLLIIAMICGTAVFCVREFRGTAPVQPVNPQPYTPQPQPMGTLEDRVQQAIGEDPDLALRYAALYATAMGVVGDDSRNARKVQDEIERARKLMGLESNAEFKRVVADQMKPYGGAKPNREQWSAALAELSEACRKAAE